MSTSKTAILSSARYGKDKVRVFRVVKDGDWHTIVEYNVTALLEGDVDESYTQADNSVVVATDSIKNITYYMAKVSPHVLNPEMFAIHLGAHLVSKYGHIHKAFVTIEKLRWARIPAASGAVAGREGHGHAFWRDGNDKWVVNVEVDGTNGKDNIVARITSGIADLLVLKTTGSAFERFIRDEYTTLAEVNDRIFSTSINLVYTFVPVQVCAPTDEKKLELVLKGEAVATLERAGDVQDRVRKITLDVFAVDESASVQATLYKMAQQVVDENVHVENVTYTLPNKHYIPVDMHYIGVENVDPAHAEVFVPISAPSGLIQATIKRARVT